MNARQVHLLNENIYKARERLATLPPGQKIRTTSQVAKYILLQEGLSNNGRVFSTKGKSVGAGVYEVWLEERGGE